MFQSVLKFAHEIKRFGFGLANLGYLVPIPLQTRNTPCP